MSIHEQKTYRPEHFIRAKAITMEMILEAAIIGARCPGNGEIQDKLRGMNLPTYPRSHNSFPSQLAAEGEIRHYVSGRNFRQVRILKGEHGGKMTAPNPWHHRMQYSIGRDGKKMERV